MSLIVIDKNMNRWKHKLYYHVTNRYMKLKLYHAYTKDKLVEQRLNDPKFSQREIHCKMY